MKRSALTAFITFLLLLATLGAKAASTFDLTFRNTPIEKVITDLRKRTGYDFVYQKDVLAGNPHVSGSFHNLTLQQILNRIFVEDLNVAYEIVDKTIILSKASKELPYFKRDIYGMVTDEAGEPLVGATVFVEDTKVGTATDVDGEFSLIAEGQRPRLRVSYVGMKTKTVQLKPGERTVVITLEEDPKLMDEVIVTGYSNFKRESATGAYQTITAADLDKRHMGSITDNLEGKIPGLVNYDNGKGKQMSIRGTGSFEASNNPLVVVDGLPIEGSIESVNPYDIENITVLKDAAAAAIYGARASNGVIVITTKRAKGSKTQVDFNADVTTYEKNNYSYLGYASAAEMVELESHNFNYVLNAADRSPYNSLLNYYNTGRASSISPATRLLLEHSLGKISAGSLESGLNALRSNDYVRQWQDAMEAPKVNQQYNLAVRHNSDALASSLTLNYMRDNNAAHGDYDSNIMFGYNGIWHVFKSLDVNFGFNMLSERTKNHINDQFWGSPSSFLPYYSLYAADGSLSSMTADIPIDLPALSNQAYGLKDVGYNPISDYGTALSRQRRTNIRTYVNAVYTILPGWTASGMFQYEDIYYKGDTYYAAESYKMRNMYNSYTAYDKATGTVTHHIPEGGMLNTNTSEGSYYTFRAQTTYDNTFAGKHDINAAFGFEYRQQNTKTYGNVMLGYDDQTQTNANSMVNWGQLQNIAGSASVMGPDYSMYGAPESNSFTTGDVLHRFYSLYFTGNYVYDSRYAATASVRIDKADLFGADPKFRGRPLWSAGLSWNMHNEAFLSDTDWLDALKLRVSYGLTGNIANDVSSYLTGSIGINSIYGNKYVTLDTPPNEQLRWEKTSTWNAGVDFSLWGSRLTGAIDFYSKRGSDLLTNTDLDPTTGWTMLKINNGKVLNTGVELQLNGDILRQFSRSDLGISAELSFAYNHNKVTKVDHLPATGAEALQSSTLHKGYPVHSLFSYDFAGMVNEGEMQYYSWRDSQGNVRTSDINSEEFTVNDIVYSGSLDPKYIASFSPMIKWQGFTLSAMLSYYGGHVMRVDCNQWTSDGSVYGFGSLAELDAIPSSYLNYWREGADKYPANGYLGGSHVVGNGTLGSQTVVPADFMKFRNLVLGYNFDDKICKKIMMRDLRLRFQINDLCTWVRNSRGVDPEANNALSGERSLKTPRSYTFSILFSF